MELILATHKLTKHFGKIRALQDLTLEVKKGEIFGLLGPNGSGKTTTLGLILGVVNKSGGDYQWFGQPQSKEQRKKIGAILETPVFYPYLSGRRNLQIVAYIKEISNQNINPVLSKVGLLSRANDKFKTYSLGMKQRLAIASALLCNPNVMILDEPTNGLDPQGIAEIRELIIQIGKEGKTIILASHLLDEVQKVCSHFAVLKEGHCIHKGLVETVTEGMQTIELTAADNRTADVLSANPAVQKHTRKGELYKVTLKAGHNAAELNRYLFENNITISHLVTQKKSLEKQFLEILNQQPDA